MDGSLVVYDKEKEEAQFSPEEEDAIPSGSSDSNGANANGVDHRARLQIYKSVHSKNQKINPVASWKLSHQRINAFTFSPDNRHLAVVSEDGSLRVIDYLEEEYAHSHNQSMRFGARSLLTFAQATGPVPLVLRRSDLGLLVSRWQVRLDRRPGRFDNHLVRPRLGHRGPLSGAPLLGIRRRLRSLALR